jgi:hypothetical protein
LQVKAKPSRPHALYLKDTAQRSTANTGTRLFTDAQAAHLNETVLANAAVEWRPVPEDQQSAKAMDALARSAK